MKPLALLFAGRFRLAGLVLAVFLVLNTLVRLGLLAFNGDGALLAPGTLVPILAIGGMFDLAAACWWLPPFALLAALWPDGPRSQRPLRIVAGVLLTLTFGVWALVGVSEFVFWNEFASRFNFIAVDYLIYTREVIGNIRESYDLRPLFAGVGIVAVSDASRQYLNRLSDLLFVLARWLNKSAGQGDVLWQKGKNDGRDDPEML